ncbi:Hypothetical protein EAG7_04946 [Klebsiella aerogenes]|nr:Hypothetical protein EAG7_04946 [Klebsiella aerogenes]CCG33442.1 hypothetical protein [Klebsiella aerogenes EA1509E]
MKNQLGIHGGGVVYNKRYPLTIERPAIVQTLIRLALLRDILER